MFELRISTHVESMAVAVGYGEPLAALPTEIRVLEPAVAELVAKGITERIASAQACGHQPLIELDVLVAHADRILTAAQARRQSRSPDDTPGSTTRTNHSDEP